MIRANRMRWMREWAAQQKREGDFYVWWRGLSGLGAWLDRRGFVARSGPVGRWHLTPKGLAAFDDSVRAYQRHGRRWWE